MTSPPAAEQGGPAVAQRAILAIGGDPRTTAQVRAAILDAGFDLVGRCLDARTLLAMTADTQPDVVLLNTQLAGFSDATVTALRGYNTYPVLVDDSAPSAADGTDIFGELALRLRPGELASQLPGLSEHMAELAAAGLTVPDSPAPAAPVSAGFTAPATIVTVTSGKGSPGKTTVSLGLAAALGSVFGPDRIRLADFDLRGGDVAPWLALDQSRGLVNVRLPGVDSPERAAAEIADTRFHFRAFAGLERGAETYRLIYEDASRCLAALAADAPPDGLVLCDTASQAEPQFAISRSRVTVLVCGADMLGSWRARGAVQALLADGAPLVLAVNKTRPGLERLDEIREALGLGPQASVSGGRRGVAVVGIPYDERVDEMPRAGRVPNSGALARAFHELAFAVVFELARVDQRWGAGADLLAAGPASPLQRLRRRSQPTSLPTADAPTPPSEMSGSGLLPQLLARARGGGPGAGSSLVQRLAGRIRPVASEGGDGTASPGPAGGTDSAAGAEAAPEAAAGAARASGGSAGAPAALGAAPPGSGLLGRVRSARPHGGAAFLRRLGDRVRPSAAGAGPQSPPVPATDDPALITHPADEAVAAADPDTAPDEETRYQWGAPPSREPPPPPGPSSGGT